MTFGAGEDIRARTFRYACDVGQFTFTSTAHTGWRSILEQLLKSGTAVGANLEEAKAASTRREFVRYVEIALREARESTYWLRVISALQPGSALQSDALRKEGEQITRILGAIVVNTKKRT